jgi:hypothetical protein
MNEHLWGVFIHFYRHRSSALFPSNPQLLLSLYCCSISLYQQQRQIYAALNTHSFINACFASWPGNFILSNFILPKFLKIFEGSLKLFQLIQPWPRTSHFFGLTSYGLNVELRFVSYVFFVFDKMTLFLIDLFCGVNLALIYLIPPFLYLFLSLPPQINQ